MSQSTDPAATILLCPTSAETATLYSEVWLNPNKDSGVDIRFPADIEIKQGETAMISLGVRAACILGSLDKQSGYWLAPRSSFAKTPQVLMLRNEIGVIDAKYRSELKAAVYNLGPGTFNAKRGDALFQLLGPALQPPIMMRTDDMHPLFRAGAERRGDGFGSSGAAGQSEKAAPAAPSSDTRSG